MAREIAATVGEFTGNSLSDVHVLFHEKQRDDWARGLTLASRRNGEKKTPARAEYASISRIKYDPEREADYLRLRRDVLHPGMATMPGFVSASLFRVSDADNEYLLVIRWLTQEDAERYHQSDLHEEFRQKAMTLLPRPLETHPCEIVHVMDEEG